MDPAEVLTRTTDLPDAVVRYAGHADGIVDVYLPPQAPDATAGGGAHAPGRLLVIVHGGFWKQRYDRLHVRPLAQAFAAEGLVVAVPEYRRVGGGGGWPVTADDVRSAVERLPDLLAGLGVPVGDATLLGHSAGGQIVLWLAGEGLPLRHVVALAPVADLAAAAKADLGDGAVQAFLGGARDEVPDAYAAADPLRRLDGPTSSGVTLLHGVDDVDVPVAQSRAVAARHPQVGLIELAGVEHYAVIDPMAECWPVVRDAVLEGEPGVR